MTSTLAQALLAGLVHGGTAAPLAGPRVYALALRDGAVLPGIEPATGGLLYTGISETQKPRDHFRLASSGSSPRRALGSLLRQQLGLEPQARGAGGNSPSPSHYHFERDCEARLSAWMLAKLLFCHPPIHGAERNELEAIEGQLIAALCPPLNVDKRIDIDAPSFILVRGSWEASRDAARTSLG
jgi:hypothetical protein